MGVWRKTSFSEAYTMATTCWLISDIGLTDTDVMLMYNKDGMYKI
jgi:hypothetical protein